MIWLSVAGYFAAWALVWPVLLIVYAKTLLALARWPAAVRFPLALLTYLAMAVAIAAPMAALSQIRPWRSAMNGDGLFVAWFAACFALSFVPGLRLFSRRYLPALKRAGYFSRR